MSYEHEPMTKESKAALRQMHIRKWELSTGTRFANLVDEENFIRRMHPELSNQYFNHIHVIINKSLQDAQGKKPVGS